VGDDRRVDLSHLTPQEVAGFESAWRLFVSHDRRWPAARDRWLEQGGAAPYVLAENLFRYFWSASKYNLRAEVRRVGLEASHVGEPAVAYFTKPLVTDLWPLEKPVTALVFNCNDPKKPIRKTFTKYDIDDMTRQHAAEVLAYIGPPAVPTLLSSTVQDSPVPSAKRYAAYALGAIATDEAVAALGRQVKTAKRWQDRGAAAKGLGFALRKNPAARPPLEEALQDSDPFVRKKAAEALAGKTRLEF